MPKAEYLAHFSEESRRRREGSRKPLAWNQIAEVILNDHALELAEEDLAFVTQMGRRRRRPSKWFLLRLRRIADRVGVAISETALARSAHRSKRASDDR